MTRDQKNEYLVIALSFQKIGVSTEMADRVIETYESILKLKGDFSIKDAVEISLKFDRKYKEIELKKNSDGEK